MVMVLCLFIFLIIGFSETVRFSESVSKARCFSSKLVGEA